jgi:rubredoxin
MKTYMCAPCGLIYSEELGLPEDGIAPGTPWEDIPEDWSCPDCGAKKADFMIVDSRESTEHRIAP